MFTLQPTVVKMSLNIWLVKFWMQQLEFGSYTLCLNMLCAHQGLSLLFLFFSHSRLDRLRLRLKTTISLTLLKHHTHPEPATKWVNISNTPWMGSVPGNFCFPVFVPFLCQVCISSCGVSVAALPTSHHGIIHAWFEKLKHNEADF